MAVSLEDLVSQKLFPTPSQDNIFQQEDTSIFDKISEQLIKPTTIPSTSPATSVTTKPYQPSSEEISIYQKQIIDEARQRGLDPARALALFSNESGFNNSLISNKGAMGMGQIIPSTAQSRGLDQTRLRNDPSYSIKSSLDYLAELKQHHGGNEDEAFQSYYGRGVNQLAGGTSDYVGDNRRKSLKMQEIVDQNPPGILSRIGTGISNFANTITPGLNRANEAMFLQSQAQQAGETGAAETALSLGTGLVGAGSGAIHFIEGAVGALGSPNNSSQYWKNLVEQSRKISENLTYTPKSEVGQALTGAVSAPMELLHEFSQRASEAPILKMFLNEDQRQAVAYAHELVTFIAADAAVRGAAGGIRSKVAKFKNEFSINAGGNGPKNPTAVADAATDLAEAASQIPEIKQTLEEAKAAWETRRNSLASRQSDEVLTPPGQNPDRLADLQKLEERQNISPSDTSVVGNRPAMPEDLFPPVEASGTPYEFQQQKHLEITNPLNITPETPITSGIDITNSSVIPSQQAISTPPIKPPPTIPEPSLSSNPYFPKSKVFHEVYHGTPETFPSKDAKTPMFFIDNPKVAEGYTSVEGRPQAGNIRVAHINLENPLELSGTWSRLQVNEFFKKLDLKNPTTKELNPYTFNSKISPSAAVRLADSKLDSAGIMKTIEKAGYDGIIQSDSRTGANEYAVFNANQIRGKFEEPPSQTPAIKRSRGYKREKNVPFSEEERANYNLGIEEQTTINRNISAPRDTSSMELRSSSQPSKLSSEEKLQYLEESTKSLPDSPEQFFPQSKVRNTEGNLTEVYHGTQENFGPTYEGPLKYFTEDPNVAAQYPGGNAPQIIRPTYLNITNPFDITSIENRRIYGELLNTIGKEKLPNWLKENGYDGILDKGSDGTTWIALDNSQILGKFENPTYKLIQDSIEKGVDISSDLPENVRPRFQEALQSQREGIASSEPRSVMNILSDIKELLMFDVNEGSFGSTMGQVTLSYRQKMAAQRLYADAQKAGESLTDHLTKLGMNSAKVFEYDSYMKSINNPPPPSGISPANMHLDPDSFPGTGSDPVIKARTLSNGLQAPPVYESDGTLLYNAKESFKTPHIFSPETPIRGFERHDVKPIYQAWRRSQRAADADVKVMREDLKNLSSTVSFLDKRNIANNIYDRTVEGAQLLNELGRTADPLTPDQTRVMKIVESTIQKNIIDRVNEVRNATGRDSIDNVDSPVMFARTFANLMQQGEKTNLVTAPISEIWGKYNSHEYDHFPKTLTQKQFKISSENDLFRIYDQFATQTLEQINLAPLVTKLHELTDTGLPGPFPEIDPRTGNPKLKWQLKNEKPNTYDFLTRWTKFIDGRPEHSMGKLMGTNIDLDRVAMKLNENMAFALLSTGVHSFIAQPASLVNTAYTVGVRNTLDGIKMSLSDLFAKTNHREFALKNSNVLEGRRNTAVYNEFGDAMVEGNLDALKASFKEGRMRDVQSGIGRMGMAPLEAADLESAIITWNAAKNYGEKVLNLTGRKLYDLADDIVVKTQGSGWRGDLSPVQRGAAGKVFTQFQTFALSDFNFIWSDVLGKDGVHTSAKDFMADPKPIIKNVAKLAAIITAYNVVMEDVLQISTPLPSPIREAMKSANRGDSPLAVAMKFATSAVDPYVPVIGSSRYGQGVGGPFLGKIAQTYQALNKAPGNKGLLEPLTEMAGVPGAATGFRLSNPNDQRNVYQRLMNTPVEKEVSSSLSGGLSSGRLKGSLGGRLK